MKKYLISGAVILAFVLYAIRGQFNKSPSQTNLPTQLNNSGQTNSPSPTPTPVTIGRYKDGSYNGSVADAFYGLLQVRAIIKGGKITDVQFLQYPNDQRESIQVNSASNPILRSEAIQAQSANVDTVTGATQSSAAFKESLAAALALAK
jgi:uncharacterized protein with FMN-binding domain